MRAPRWLSLAALIAITAVVISGCGGSGGDNGAIKIGVVSNLTGPDTVNGRDMARGAELAAKQVNAAGGVNGRKLDVIVEDSEYKAVSGVNAARKLIDVDQVKAIVSVGGSAVMVPMGKFAKTRGGVVINTGASSPEIRELAGTVYSVIPLDDVLAAGFAKWVHDLGLERVAVLMPSNPFGTGLNSAFTQEFEKLGGQVVASVNFKESQQDYRPELQRIKAAAPEAIVTGAYGADAELLWKQSEQIGLSSPWLVAYPTGLPIRHAAGRIFGVDVGYELPSANALRQAYTKEYGDPPKTASAVYGYEGMKFAARALAKSKGDGGDALGNALLAVGKHFDGVTGQIELDEQGQREKAPYVFLAMTDDGDFVKLDDQPSWRRRASERPVGSFRERGRGGDAPRADQPWGSRRSAAARARRGARDTPSRRSRRCRKSVVLSAGGSRVRLGGSRRPVRDRVAEPSRGSADLGRVLRRAHGRLVRARLKGRRVGGVDAVGRTDAVPASGRRGRAVDARGTDGFHRIRGVATVVADREHGRPRRPSQLPRARLSGHRGIVTGAALRPAARRPSTVATRFRPVAADRHGAPALALPLARVEEQPSAALAVALVHPLELRRGQQGAGRLRHRPQHAVERVLTEVAPFEACVGPLELRVRHGDSPFVGDGRERARRAAPWSGEQLVERLTQR